MHTLAFHVTCADCAIGSGHRACLDKGVSITIEGIRHDVRVRQAFQYAVDNGVVLQLGIDGAGREAENHHVGPMHIEYADVGPHVRDVEKAKSLLAEAGYPDGIDIDIYTSPLSPEWPAMLTCARDSP